MNDTLRNCFALILGLLVGAAVNMALIGLGGVLVPAPAGADLTTSEGLARSLHLLQGEHFVFPYFGHALGTFTGALTAYAVAVSYKNRLAVAVGIFFLCGGIANVVIVPAPMWFSLLDLVSAYLPPTWFAILAGERLAPRKLAAA